MKFIRKSGSRITKWWWAETLSNIVGTVIGIVITFGVGFWIEAINKNKDREMTTMIIVWELQREIDSLYGTLQQEKSKEELLKQLIDLTPQEVETMSEDSVLMYLTVFSNTYSSFNNFGRHLLNSNLDIWRSADDLVFLMYVEDVYEYLNSIEQSIAENGPNTVLAKVNKELEEEALRQDLKDDTPRWNLLEVTKSSYIKHILYGYLSTIMQIGDTCEILKDLRLKVLEGARITPEEFLKFFNEHSYIFNMESPIEADITGDAD